MKSEYISIQVEAIDKELCFKCEDLDIEAIEAFADNEIIYRRYECRHFKRCKELIEKFKVKGV